MNKYSPGTSILALSLPLVILITAGSFFGLCMPDTYARETANWTAQAVGQDMVNFFLIVPFLLVTSILAYRGHKVATLLWGGAIFYLVYTYVIYCFAVHFNELFVLYCITLGLSFYSFLYFLFLQIREPVITAYNEKVPSKTVGVYLIVIAGLFYLLWLAEIVPAIVAHTTPATIRESGLPINPVHALDLSICLPGLAITGMLLIRKKLLGLLLAPAMLVFCILMDITIGGLVIIMKIKGIESDVSLTMIMGALAMFSVVLLVHYVKAFRENV